MNFEKKVFLFCFLADNIESWTQNKTGYKKQLHKKAQKVRQELDLSQKDGGEFLGDTFDDMGNLLPNVEDMNIYISCKMVIDIYPQLDLKRNAGNRRARSKMLDFKDECIMMVRSYNRAGVSYYHEHYYNELSKYLMKI